jgi:hypothetical protein
MKHTSMRTTLVALVFASTFSWATQTSAQSADVTGEPFLRASLLVTMFDSLSAQCNRSGGFSANDAAKVERWQAANSVEHIRNRMREMNASHRQQAEKVATDNAQAIIAKGFAPCAAAVRVTTLPDAQLATAFPQLMAQAETANKASATKSNATAAPPATTTTTKNAASNAQQSEILKQIEGFGFDTGMQMGVGGFLAVTTYPIVFFRNGDLLKDVTGLAYNGGPQAHQRAKPREWSRWRRNGGEIQVESKDGWKRLHYQTFVSRLPDDFKLNGLFRSLSGAGNVAMGGTQSVAAWSDYRFATDGTVTRGGGAGGSGQTGNTSVVTGSTATNRRGRYRIEDGLMLAITYDDGSSERRILITSDPKDPKAAIWLDGVGYVRRDK